MNRLATLAMTAVLLLLVGAALLAGDGIGYAQQRSDSETLRPPLMPFMQRCRI